MKSPSPSSVKASAYKSLMDWWVAILVAVFLLMILLSIPLLTQTLQLGLPLLASVAILIVIFILVVDRAFFLRYSLAENGLIISTQLYHLLIPYRAMTSIKNGNILHLITIRHHKRFALSSHCLTIALQKGQWRQISVSPKERQQFLSALLAKIEEERNQRASIRKHRHV